MKVNTADAGPQSTDFAQDDAFRGYDPQPIRCRWLSKDDERRAPSARVIRLVVDDNRWAMDCINATYQRHTLKDVSEFVGPTKAVLATPAGMITTSMPPMKAGANSIDVGLEIAAGILQFLDLGPSPPEMLLGIDGCRSTEATPLQTVVHLARVGTPPTTGNTTFKLYPMGAESRFLVGWLATQAMGEVPTSLTQARRVKTGAGLFVVLVCNDACAFSRRSRANLVDETRIGIREHFVEEVSSSPRPDFILMATHHQESSRSGGIFKNAASILAEDTRATVVTTMFTRIGTLDTVAEYFPTQGDRADEVVTLLVQDTLNAN